MNLLYKSTRNAEKTVTASEAILKGLADDGGLFMPVSIPKLDVTLSELKDMTYQETAYAVMKQFLTDFTEEELKNCINKAYDAKFDTEEIAPLVKADDTYYLELFHGATIAFKDMALSILPHLLTTSAKKNHVKNDIVILTATSGDTGKAALAGFADVEGTKIIVFYPKNGVSKVQELQMVTQKGANTAVVAIHGNFDCAQSGVKAIFEDKEFAKDIQIQGDICFHDVTFGYNSYDPVLEHINLDVKKGEMIGLVGASGTGKSTMINLIMRLYDVDRGTITVDGIDLRDIKQESFHSQLGVVLQETFLFSGTILNNIRFAKPDATMEEIIKAAKAANAHDFICKTPDGYNTYVGERGFNLSGGERQRIAIARAILNNPRLLILDEATSALDTESEYLIQQALDRLTEGRTTFAIAHRLSTLRNANRLVVIDGHEIAEVGTHDELLEKKGIYYGLVTAQLQMAKL